MTTILRSSSPVHKAMHGIALVLVALGSVAACSSQDQDSVVASAEPGRLGIRCESIPNGIAPPPQRAPVESCNEAQFIPDYCFPYQNSGLFPYEYPDGRKECWCSGGCDPGPDASRPDVAVDAGPKCKTCDDLGETACGEVDNGCGGTITCAKCPDGQLCDLAQKTCIACGAPPDTPGSSSTPPFTTTKLELPGGLGEAACEAIKRLPYIGAALTAGYDKPTLKFVHTSGGSSSSTGMQKCVEKTKVSKSDTYAVDICAVTLAYTATGTGEQAKSYCAECVDGQGKCGALSCDQSSDSAGGRGSVSRKIREKSGLGDLILCPPGDATCAEFSEWLNKKFGIDVEGAITASAGTKSTTKTTTPGTCSPCKDCKESSFNFEPRLTGTVKGKFGATLFDAGRWGKVSAGLAVGSFVGVGLGGTDTVKSGACGAETCREFYGSFQGGIFIEFEVVAFRLERNWSWVGRCELKVGGKYCEPGGLAPTWDVKCSANDASVFDVGAD